MPSQPVILPDADAVGSAVAELVLDRLARTPTGPFILGCPGGRTCMPTYRALAAHAEKGVDLSRVVIAMMDDYVVPGDDGEYRRIDPELSYSCLGFARRDILAPITEAALRAGTTPPTEIWMPDPADPARYDADIEGAGGFDLFLLASGDSDGHIAFNPPGSDRHSGTRITPLAEATREDNMATFPELTRRDMVPAHGVTVGIATIAERSREVVMILTGANKRRAFSRIVAADGYEADWPATIVAECTPRTVFADRAAAVS